ncbi:MAG: hypothetical protein Q7S22_06320 [Candidatus Micrarchaeota archaeon]|nr:hypothetical protein [Candidatus Micrarchaeota archaeon]
MADTRISEEIKKIIEEPKVSTLLNSIQISLDEYDDIFSDFDPSPYAKRLLSEDFLKEIQRRYIETDKGEIEIRFTLPAKLRDMKTEGLIKKRLNHYFLIKIKDMDNQLKKLKTMGITYFIVGFALLSLDIFIYDSQGLMTKLLSILLTPAGWYGMYTGLEHIFSHPSELVEKRSFYERFQKAKYVFISEEELVKHVEEVIKPTSAMTTESKP